MKLLQNEKGYRYSLDPFLLASFVELKGNERVIDLGTGNGVIAVLLATRYSGLQVTGVELQSRLAEMAAENVRQNGLEDRVRIIQGDIREIPSLLPAGVFEAAVGNPPYRKARTGRVSLHEEKAAARHELTLSLEDFVAATSYLLCDRGRLSLIYHPARLPELFALFQRFRIAPRRLRPIHSRIDASAVMALVEGVKNGRNQLSIEKPLIIYKACSERSESKGKEYTLEVENAFPE